MNPPVPLLILSDAPSCGAGLGRIIKDLAIRIHKCLSDVCRIATLGHGELGSRHLDFSSASLRTCDWIVPVLPQVWEDFSGEEKGICMTIWDASRLM